MIHWQGILAHLCIIFGICFFTLSAVIADDCIQSVPQKVIVHIDNNTTEEEIREFLSELGVLLDTLESQKVYLRLKGEPESYEKIKNDPYVDYISSPDHKSDDYDYLIYFVSQVTDQYVSKLIDSNPGMSIQKSDPRAPREAKITVPTGEEEQWIEKIAANPFVIDASQKCVSEYVITCKQYGGTFDSKHGYCIGLPSPDINWDEVLPDRVQECQRTNGEWFTFSSTCQDECSFEAAAMCGQAVTQGCECGPDRCSVGKYIDGTNWTATCINNPDWHHKMDFEPSFYE